MKIMLPLLIFMKTTASINYFLTSTCYVQIEWHYGGDNILELKLLPIQHNFLSYLQPLIASSPFQSVLFPSNSDILQGPQLQYTLEDFLQKNKNIVHYQYIQTVLYLYMKVHISEGLHGCDRMAVGFKLYIDCLPHDILLRKLSAYGFTENSIKLLYSYLSYRKQQIKIGNIVCMWEKVQKGVPQDQYLAPYFLMFLLMIFSILFINLICIIMLTTIRYHFTPLIMKRLYLYYRKKVTF